MKELLSSKHTVVEDEEVLSKFNSFRDGIGDVLAYLYKKDNVYYLVLSPYDSLFLEEEFCIRVEGKDNFLRFIDDLTCNIGFIILDDNSKLSYKFLNNTIRCGNCVYDLVDVCDLYIKSKEDKSLLFGDALIKKIKEMKSSIFSSDRNSFISPYIYNTMYKKTLDLYSLDSFEFSVLDKYKRRGYEFINSFLRDTRIKRNSSFEVINKAFIDDLYCLYGIFDKFPTLEEEMIVFRGGSEEEVICSDYDSFISTSLDISVASSFSSCLLYEIILPKGTHYIPIDAIDELSSIFGETEAEILLRPSSFEIITSGIRKEYNFVKVICHEKDNFGEIIVNALERKKDDLINRGLCDEDGYDEVFNYAKSKVSSEKIKKLK